MSCILFSFDQCLSTWESKTPDSVITFGTRSHGYGGGKGGKYGMLEGSKCPNQTVVPTSGPWCQGLAQGCFDSNNTPSQDSSHVPNITPSKIPSKLPTKMPSKTPTSRPNQVPTNNPTKKKKSTKKSKNQRQVIQSKVNPPSKKETK